MDMFGVSDPGWLLIIIGIVAFFFWQTMSNH